jgi:hypothetical protein
MYGKSNLDPFPPPARGLLPFPCRRGQKSCDVGIRQIENVRFGKADRFFRHHRSRPLDAPEDLFERV